MTNESDAFREEGPTVGKSVFEYNYYGPGLLVDAEGYFNQLHLQRRIPLESHQVWKMKSAKLLHQSGNTDSDFFCNMERRLDDPKARVPMKVGQEMVWINGYKVFELKASPGLDRYSDERRLIEILDRA